jgi:hypothetical protein
VWRRRRTEPAVDDVEDQAADLGLELTRVPAGRARD